MPNAPKRPCLYPGCPEYAVLRGRCATHAAQAGYRPGSWGAPSRTAAQRLRGHAWMRIRRQVLTEEWRCYLCGEGGTDADVIDHVVPLSQGGTDDRTNLRRCCRACHARKTARESVRGRWS